MMEEMEKWRNPISGLLLPGAKTRITMGSRFSMVQVTPMQCYNFAKLQRFLDHPGRIFYRQRMLLPGQ